MDSATTPPRLAATRSLIGLSGDTWLSTFHEFDPIVFNLTSNNVTAVGGFFFLTDLTGNVAGGTVTVTLNNGSMFFINNASSTSFIGFTTSVPIEFVTVTPPASGPSLIFATANDLLLGRPCLKLAAALCFSVWLP